MRMLYFVPLSFVTFSSFSVNKLLSQGEYQGRVEKDENFELLKSYIAFTGADEKEKN